MKHTRLGGITPRCKQRGIIKINGKIVSEGKRLGISTPYNETVWAAISLLDLAAQ
jgi:ketopantoate reductase